MQRVSKELLKGLFPGNRLTIKCATVAEFNSTYESVRQARKDLQVSCPDLVLAVNVKSHDAEIEVIRCDDDGV